LHFRGYLWFFSAGVLLACFLFASVLPESRKSLIFVAGKAGQNVEQQMLAGSAMPVSEAHINEPCF